jgi:hypothetical protein
LKPEEKKHSCGEHNIRGGGGGRFQLYRFPGSTRSFFWWRVKLQEVKKVKSSDVDFVISRGGKLRRDFTAYKRK